MSRVVAAVVAVMFGGTAHAAAPDDSEPMSDATQRMDSDPIAQAPKRPRRQRAPVQPAPLPPKPSTPTGPTQPRLQAGKPETRAPSVSELATLYTTVGRELSAAAKRDPNATIDLWPRFRWVRFADALQTSEKRAEAAALLQRLLDDTRKLH